jgi:hypothetical protein
VASGQGSASVTVNFGSTAGNVNVSAINGCGTTLGTAQAVTFISVPTGSGIVSGNASPCSNTSATYTVSGITGATGYAWSLPSGSTGNSNANSINVLFGSNNGSIIASGYNSCGTVTSSAFAISLSPAPAGAGTISGPNSVCASGNANYSITPVTGATSYIWSLGNASGNSNASSISVTFPSNSGISTLTVVPVFACGNGSPSSTSVTISPLLTPSVSIQASAAQVCSGQSITYTASGTNLGTSTNITWLVNGVNNGVTTQVFTYNAPTNGDQVSATITTTGGCFATNVASSNVIIANVSGTQNPSVGIAIQQGNNPTCQADQVTFVATSTGGGTNPTYQWLGNGNNVGTNSNTYSGTGFSNGDQISVVLTSSLSCASPSSVVSNTITLTSIPNGTFPCLSPVVSSITGSVNVIPNQTVIYSVTSVGGVTYTWSVTGVGSSFSGQGTNTITVNWGSSSGTVSLIETNNYGSSNPTTITISMPTGYDNNSVTNDLSLFPNPSSNTFSIRQGNGFSNTLIVSITDDKGIPVLQNYNANTSSSFGADLSAGHYIVTIITDSGVKRLPFVKLN